MIEEKLSEEIRNRISGMDRISSTDLINDIHPDNREGLEREAGYWLTKYALYTDVKSRTVELTASYQRLLTWFFDNKKRRIEENHKAWEKKNEEWRSRDKKAEDIEKNDKQIVELNARRSELIDKLKETK